MANYNQYCAVCTVENLYKMINSLVLIISQKYIFRGLEDIKGIAAKEPKLPSAYTL